MTVIFKGSAASLAFSVQLDGAPVPLSGPVTAQVYTMDGRTLILPSWAADSATAGADWPGGVVMVQITESDAASLPPGDAMLVLAGGFGVRRFRVVVEELAPSTRTSLFVRDIVVDELRADRLFAAAAGILQDVKVSDRYLWEKVLAAESELSHTLRVPLVPTRYFPIPPTQVELAALGDMAWAIDPGYDYDPAMFERDKWGYLVARHRPIISVQYMRFAYPKQDIGFFDVPPEWLRIDSRPGHLRIVPSSSAVLMGTAGFAMSSMLNRRTVPDMVQLSYTAGLVNAGTDYPELIDVIKKMAVLKIVEDSFLPQSGSISADGLSQSLSVDMSKYADAIDVTVNGRAGSNGGLMTKIHGIRAMVF